ncbi:methyl-accepting chemotaxis protein [Massilia sp. W12]|uniref:methyl-accepting chemotaxis protein n=1 Tax=Massilia sp. W12 TaxID=3126507 RepID=UPI0030D04A59
MKNFAIKSLLVFVIGFMSLLLVMIGGLGLYGQSSANDALKSVYDERTVAIGKLDNMVRALLNLQLAAAYAVGADQDMIKTSLSDIKKYQDEAEKTWAQIAARPMNAKEKELGQRFTAHRERFYNEGLKPAVAALTNDYAQQAMDLIRGPMKTLFAPLIQDVNQMIELQLQAAQQEYTQSQSRYEVVRNISLLSITLGVALAGVLGWLLVNGITRPLAQAARLAESVAAGDLSHEIEVDSDNEMGKLLTGLKHMNDSLVKIVSEVRQGTDSMAQSSSEIARGNMDLSQRTEAQAGSLEETSSSMEELTATVKQNADNARQANQLAASASDVAVRGGSVFSHVVDTMNSISDSSKKIVDIIAVIDGIAFQTNILALNAAVEAARAGEQGRGFAVVAGEVRSLAQRSAAAAKEIKGLINDSVEKVETGSRLVHESRATMDEIVASVRRVTDIMGEISAASQEQTAGIEQISDAVLEMDEATQQNAALVEQAAAAAQALQEQSDRLARLVSVFKLKDGMLRAQARPAAAAARPPSKPAARALPKPRPAPAARPAAKAAEDGWEEF